MLKAKHTKNPVNNVHDEGCHGIGEAVGVGDETREIAGSFFDYRVLGVYEVGKHVKKDFVSILLRHASVGFCSE